MQFRVYKLCFISQNYSKIDKTTPPDNVFGLENRYGFSDTAKLDFDLISIDLHRSSTANRSEFKSIPLMDDGWSSGKASTHRYSFSDENLNSKLNMQFSQLTA